VILSALAPGRLVFTSGATEANNIVLAPLGEGALVLSSKLEHPSVREPLEAAASRGADIRWIPNDREGSLDIEFVQRTLEATAVTLVAVMAANNELGTLNPVDAIAELCSIAEVDFHVDAVQAFGRTRWRPEVGVTSATVSGHKLRGPTGIGALWLREGQSVQPHTLGGHQERGLRPGTENVLGAIGFAAAVEHVDDWSVAERARGAFESALLEGLDAQRNGMTERRLPNTSNLSFAGCEAEELLMALDLAGVACSAGSACTAGSIDVSPVVEALGLGPERARSALRFSFGPQDTEAFAVEAAARIREVVARIRR
jgi:cysteine desulfurase